MLAYNHGFALRSRAKQQATHGLDRVEHTMVHVRAVALPFLQDVAIAVSGTRAAATGMLAKLPTSSLASGTGALSLE